MQESPSFITSRHDPKPVEHLVRLTDPTSNEPLLQTEWLGDEASVLVFTAPGSKLVTKHDLIEAFFQAYLECRGFRVAKTPEREQADRAAAALNHPATRERLDAGTLDFTRSGSVQSSHATMAEDDVARGRMALQVAQRE